eukprot:3646400-Prymnesium_polylepis.1
MDPRFRRGRSYMPRNEWYRSAAEKRSAAEAGAVPNPQDAAAPTPFAEGGALMTVDALVTVGGGNKRKWNLMADVEGKGPIKTPPRSAHYTSTAWAATLLDLWPAVRILPSPKKSAAVLSEEIPSRWT